MSIHEDLSSVSTPKAADLEESESKHIAIMRAKFPSSLRIQTEDDFTYVFRRATRTTSKYIALVSRENNLGNPRLGLSLSKKNVRHAVDRNRLKRVARETFRTIQSSLNNLDIVVIAYKGAASLSPQDQHKQFNDLWNQLAQKCKKPV